MPAKPPSPLQLVGLGSAIAGMVAGGMVVGWLIDEAAGTFPILTLVGLAVGMAAAAHQLYSMFRKFTQD